MKWKLGTEKRLPMLDLVMDTGPLADLLGQYFQAEDRDTLHFTESSYLSTDTVREINLIVHGDGRHLIAASTMAFVELARKWDEIVTERFAPRQLAAFLEDPPDWFSIEPVDEDLVPTLIQVPPEVMMPDGTAKPLEWPDAIHIATTLGRQEAKLITSDRRMLRMIAERTVDHK
jgi:predicted nucleic acid-binding protein